MPRSQSPAAVRESSTQRTPPASGLTAARGGAGCGPARGPPRPGARPQAGGQGGGQHGAEQGRGGGGGGRGGPPLPGAGPWDARSLDTHTHTHRHSLPSDL